jgi:hypothetical protein
VFVVLLGSEARPHYLPGTFAAGRKHQMRYLRIAMVSAITAGALVVPSVAVGQISSISIGQAQLGPQGASLSVPVTVQCDSGWTLEFVSVSVAQKSGRFLAQGSGFASWGAPCVGPGTIVVPLTNSSFVAYKKGSAVATANVEVAGPGFFVGTATQTIKIAKTPISYIDPLGHSAVRYRARLK